MKRMLAGVLALAVTTLSVSLTLIPDAYASQPVEPADVAVTRAVAPDDMMVRVHPNMIMMLRSWTVQQGQTLSSISGARYGSQDAWPLIYWANHKHVKWADKIQVGQVLSLPAWTGTVPQPPRLTSPPPPPPPVVFHRAHSTGSSVAYSGTYHRSTTRTYHRAYTSGTYHGSGGYESCVISRESGGNTRAVNSSSGAGGLYQFLPSTWHSLGYSGSPQNASVSVQRQAFQRLYAQAGTSPWSPSDGC